MPSETYSTSIDDWAVREAVLTSIPIVVQVALTTLTRDPGALFEPAVLAAIQAVRKADPAGYARIRAQAKDAKVSVSELDRLTALPLEDRRDTPFATVEPWPEPVDGAELLAALIQVLAQHVIADEPTLIAAALWALHTWCMDAFTVSPLGHITSPDKRCGKTVLLTALARLVKRPLLANNISPAAMFRSMELWQPTLLIDEADSFLRDNEEARGLINSGLYRETAFVIRTVGDDHTPTSFRTWGPKVLCGIGKLADTIEDRSIPLRMRRKLPGERVASIRHSDPTLWIHLQQRMARWVDDHHAAIAQARPAPVIGLNDRAQDCWEPLLALADVAGGEWPGRARSAAQALQGTEEVTRSTNTELLADIQDVFERHQATRLTSALLIEELTGDEELPWATWNRGKAIAPRQLAIRLSEFGIHSKNLKMADGSVRKGYLATDFQDAFARYLSPAEPLSSATALLPHKGAGCDGSASATASATGASHPLPATAAAYRGEMRDCGDVARSGSPTTVAAPVAEPVPSETATVSQSSAVADSAPGRTKRSTTAEGARRRSSTYERHESDSPMP